MLKIPMVYYLHLTHNLKKKQLKKVETFQWYTAGY